MTTRLDALLNATEGSMLCGVVLSAQDMIAINAIIRALDMNVDMRAVKFTLRNNPLALKWIKRIEETR